MEAESLAHVSTGTSDYVNVRLDCNGEYVFRKLFICSQQTGERFVVFTGHGAQKNVRLAIIIVFFWWLRWHAAALKLQADPAVTR